VLSQFNYRDKIIACLCLALITGAVFGVALTYDFVNYDDKVYVTENPQVQAGLSIRGLFWAFTTTLQHHWHPLTMLSHMLDCQLFGLNPAGHHFTSILFHILNTILLFFILEKMTEALWPSALVAALFAIHPLHVESVAWIAARKDVLSTFFMLMTLWIYVYYAASPSTGKYLLMLALFALGLLAKSMLVTLPFIMWLLDYWPLGRWTKAFSDKKDPHSISRIWKSRILWEKLPFLFLSMIVGIITLLARRIRSDGVVVSFLPSEDGFIERLIDAANGYANYVWKMFWPTNLSLAYRDSGPAPIYLFFLSLCLLVGISFLCVMTVKRRPYLMVGWLWFLGTLLPVAGIINIGPHLAADRYTYVSLIGLFIMLSWGILDVTRDVFQNKPVGIMAMLLFLAICSILCFRQVGYWKNSITLFSHTLAVNPNSVTAEVDLGLGFHETGNESEAMAHLNRAIQLAPGNPEVQYGLGYALYEMGQYREAIDPLLETVRIAPNHGPATLQLAICLSLTGRLNEAHEYFAKAIKLNPDNPDAYYNYGYALALENRNREALDLMKKVLDIDPNYELARKRFDVLSGIELYEEGRLPEAERLLNEVIRRYPRESEAYLYLGLIASSRGQLDSAISYLRSAIAANPRYTEAYVNLGIALAQKEEYAEAEKAFSNALMINPKHVKAHFNYAACLYLQYRDKEAMEELSKALEIDPDFKEARDLSDTIMRKLSP
jgi:tetratricopeptide (TPR) repeat protein